MKRQWKITESNPETVQLFCQELKIHRATATVLCNRNIDTIDRAIAFLSPKLKELSSPSALDGVEKAAVRIEKALIEKERILIFGDYDVDGITATHLLYTFLKRAKADISYYIPHRIDEGYGFQPMHIDAVALKRGVSLIITVDCGSTSFDAIERAHDNGIDVIVTDHHHVSDTMPKALSLINPKSSLEKNGLADLSGVGVAFFLLVYLRKHLREKNYWKRFPEPNLKAYLDIVTLGTIADIVPLTGENRILTRFGLKVINQSPRPGLKALINVSGIQKGAVTSEDIAFRLAPRLNAAGRMGHAEKALKLLLSENDKEARKLALELNEANTFRQKTEGDILAAIEQKERISHPDKSSKAIVLSDPSWHEGVLGIVSSRLARSHHKPAILLCEKNGILKGSARSIEGVDIYLALSALKDDLLSFGGHSLAAGLSLKKERLPAFRSRLEAIMEKMMADLSPTREILLDCQLNLKEISSQLLEEMETLQPFGHKIPTPLFFGENIQVLSSSIIGKKHRRMILRQVGDTGNGIAAIQFNIDPDAPFIPHFHKLAFRIQWNHFNGKKTPQIIVEEH